MKFPIEMYRIREEEMKIQIPCERCLAKGIIDRTCSKCGGKGVHNKTIKAWEVAPKTVTVEKIDRSSNDNFFRGIQTSYKNGLRYWTSHYDFYNEADMYLHFTMNEAQRECDKRNESIKELLVINRKRNLADSWVKPDSKVANDDNQKDSLATLLNSLAELDPSFVYYLSCNNRLQS
ncbi:hypothetical protein [Lacrimispora sp.]|uniref:hypothetical protein n=1 Tax=Lacrimispora sp. TaxID=2719234 RepID=UPI0028AC6DFE|nr:hypothetical protein [Lacrimispora sp.]